MSLSFMVDLTTSAISRAALNVDGTESSDCEKAAAVGLYLRWMMSTHLQGDFEEELRLHAENVHAYGWSCLHVTWDRCYAQVPRRITLQSLSGFLGVDAPQQFEALQSALREQQEYLADLLVASNC